VNWDEFGLEIARTTALKSKDPSTKVGAAIMDENHIIRSIGYNGFPRGVTDYETRYNDRDIKYRLVVHAEANAILAAARVGTPLEGCTLYCTFHPCSGCAKLIAQAGIRDVVYPEPEDKEDLDRIQRWGDDFRYARLIFGEAGVGRRAIGICGQAVAQSFYDSPILLEPKSH
jgi:dCMP deaminase